MLVTLIGQSSFRNNRETLEKDYILLNLHYIGALCRNGHEEVQAEKDYHTAYENALKFFKRWVVGKGHTSLLEHFSFTFLIENISRACSHQLVRHRIASYTQKSQRYSLEENDSYVTPRSMLKDELSQAVFTTAMDRSMQSYRKLIECGVPKEDARFVLPNAQYTDIIMTMNARSLLNFFQLRAWDKTAQWEIREVAEDMNDIINQRTVILKREMWDVQ